MRQVRIVLVECDNYYDSYTNESLYAIRDSISDWEDISQEDYDLLVRYQNKLESQYDCKVLILEKDPKSVMERLASIREWVQQQRDLEEQAKKKREAAAQERANQKLLKKAKSELALLEELKKKISKCMTTNHL
jgi:hypothetical protein